MSDPTIEQLVTEYLQRLRNATADLPTAERDELIANIAHHIATSIEDLDQPSEAAVRTVLEELGDPPVIAAKAREHSSLLNTPPPRGKVPGWLEWGGVAILGIGSYLLPVIGTVAGLIMVSTSRWWSTRQKIVAAVLSSGVCVIVLVPFWYVVAGLALLGPLIAACILAVQLNRRRRGSAR
jgi:hypothetical protein